MADQTVRIEKDDVAATAFRMAQYLWSDKLGNAVANDPRFFQVVLLCSEALQGRTSIKRLSEDVSAVFK